MKIFLTGATGYIGSSLGKVLVEKGHIVYGLTRGKNKLEAVSNLGMIPVEGHLDEVEVLKQYASEVDAVIHTANSDHRVAIETFITALEGSGKVFIHSSGSSVVGDDVLGDYENPQRYTEETLFVPMDVRAERVKLNQLVRAAGIYKGIRSIVLVPAMIYGDSLGLAVQSDQLPVIFRKSKEEKKGIYLGKGINRWSNVHLNDLIDLYLLALEKAPSASYFYAAEGEESYYDIATYVSEALGYNGEVGSWKATDALAELGDWARYALGSNSRVIALHAKQLLGWTPSGISLKEWIKTTRIS